MISGPVVFLSYARRSNLEHARALEAALAAARISAFRDETELADGDPFPEALIDALLGSLIVVVFADPAYFGREYCRWELEAALAAGLRNADGLASFDHLVVALPSRPTVSHELERLPPAVRIRQWPRAHETGRLVDLIRDRLTVPGQSLAGGLGQTGATELRARLLEGSKVPLPSLSVRTPRYPSVLPVSLRNAFVGRSEVLWRIDYLLRSKYGTPETVRSTVAIEGFGGVGKTRLAVEYAHRYGHHYSGGVFWIDADTTSDRREEQLHGILRTLRPATPDLVELRLNSVDVAARLGDALAEIPSSDAVLYVVDNLPEPEQGIEPGPLSYWCPARGYVALLLTSRLRASLAEGVDPISLPELEPAAAVAVLTANLHRDTLSDGDWARIADWVGRLPLALGLLNAALRLSSLSGNRLLDLVDTGAATTEQLDHQMAAVRFQMPDQHLRGITEAFSISYLLLSPAAQRLARLIACLSPDPLPDALLDAIGDGAPSEARAAIIARSFVTHTPGTVIPTFGRMHRVLADFLRAQQSNPEAEIEALVGPLFAILAPEAIEDPQAWPRVNATIPHAEALARRIERLSPESLYTDEAQELRARIAGALRAQGDLNGARAIQEKVLAVRRRKLGPGHLSTLNAAGGLASTLRSQGDIEGARGLQEQALAGYQIFLGPEHPDTLNAEGNLANTLHSQGAFTRARALQEHVLLAEQRVLGPSHPLVLTSTHNLANTLRAQGDLSGARALQQQVLAARRSLLGPEHLDTLKAANNLANTLRAEGDLRGARGLQEQVLEARQRVLGPQHPDTLTAAGNLAVTIQGQGDLATARALQEDVLTKGRSVLGPEHPVTIHAAGNLAITLNALGDFVAAKSLEEEVLDALQRKLGPDNPDVLRAAANLANTLIALGDFEGARLLLRQARDGLRKALGPGHPDTLVSERNLAIAEGTGR